jgi:hypothetical protein
MRRSASGKRRRKYGQPGRESSHFEKVGAHFRSVSLRADSNGSPFRLAQRMAGRTRAREAEDGSLGGQCPKSHASSISTHSGNRLCDHLLTTKEEWGVARRNRVAGQPRAGRSSCSLCPDGLELRPAVLVFSPSLHCTAEPDLTGRELYGNDSSHGSRITARPRCWSLGPYVALLEVRTLGGGTSLPCSPGRAVARGTISHSNKKGARQGPRLSSFDSSVLLP